MAEPTSQEWRQQTGAGTARMHLENCTGKKRKHLEAEAGRIQSEGGDGEDTNQEIANPSQ